MNHIYVFMGFHPDNKTKNLFIPCVKINLFQLHDQCMRTFLMEHCVVSLIEIQQ